MSNEVAMKALLLGKEAVTKAVGKVLELFNIKCEESGDANCDILVMADGDSFDLKKFNGFTGLEKVIYLESLNKKENYIRHPLTFLTELCVTYRIPLESFSIVEFWRIINDIQTPSVKNENDYSIPYVSSVIKDPPKIINTILSSKEGNQELSKYLYNQRAFVEQRLHNYKGNAEEKDKIREDIIDLDYLFSLIKVPNNLPLNILIVENNPKEIKDRITDLKKHFTALKFFLISGREDGKKFSDFRQALLSGELSDIAKFIDTEFDSNAFEKEGISFDKIDFILQDIFLEQGGLSGSDFANLYFDVAPQSMVFFLTSMDVETLAATGYDKKVDRIIGKDRIKGLMKYYYERFHELYGPILWSVFVKAQDRNVESPKLDDKVAVRMLLGNIRTWTIEPGILFHGYALPEMVDHAFRHTSGLWKMANNILGPFFERMPRSIMSAKDKILLALAIWLHDIGHRGDEHHYESMEIRENHGSISESLILDHSKALGIDWLTDFCHRHECKDYASDKRKSDKRNEIPLTGNSLCHLRKLGLMCRYHQSSAPLKDDNIAKLILKMKRPSPYCVVGIKEDFNTVDEVSEEHINNWLDKTRDFGSFAHDVRTLGDFNDESLLNLTGMVRWLDALHTHNERIGSLTQVESYSAYLKMRETYCEKKVREVEELLNRTNVGSEAYLNLLAELMRLDSYSQLLDVQWIHLWRSAFVKDIKGEWFWDKEKERWAFMIVFELFMNDPLAANEEVKKVLEKLKNYYTGVTENQILWEKHIAEEVIESEIKSQTEKNKPLYFENYFQGIEISYWYKIGEEGLSEIKIKKEINNEEEKRTQTNISKVAKEKKEDNILVIDCDPGCDDALALLLAIRGANSHYTEIHITTTAGNLLVERTTFNAQKVAAVALSGLENPPEIKIYKGSGVSFMGKSPNVMSVHGRDGLGEIPNKIYSELISSKKAPAIEDESAVEYLKNLGDKSDGKKYDLVCIGPLTNLATALSLSKDPLKLLNRFEKIIIMGGAFKHSGNITPTAEFNFFFDPVSVQILFDTLKKCELEAPELYKQLYNKIVFIPLNITEKVQLNVSVIDKDRTIDNPLGKWTLCMLQKYFHFHAFSGKPLMEECINNECTHDKDYLSYCKTLGKSEYEAYKDKIKDARMIGKSGIKEMPRFCYLHDPLAVYYAIKVDPQKDESCLDNAKVNIHTGDDDMRGTVIIMDENFSIGKVKPYINGVKVRYMSPDKTNKQFIIEFKKVLAHVCGLEHKIEDGKFI